MSHTKIGEAVYGGSRLAPGALLAQVRPANTTAATAFTSPARTRTEITNIVITNTSGGAATYRLFHDDDGSTYDETTALAWNVAMAADTVVEVAGMFISGSGTLGVRTSVNSALTFSVYGTVQNAR